MDFSHPWVSYRPRTQGQKINHTFWNLHHMWPLNRHQAKQNPADLQAVQCEEGAPTRMMNLFSSFLWWRPLRHNSSPESAVTPNSATNFNGSCRCFFPPPAHQHIHSSSAAPPSIYTLRLWWENKRSGHPAGVSARRASSQISLWGRTDCWSGATGI